MSTDPDLISAPGYVKRRGSSSERNDMVVEVQGHHGSDPVAKIDSGIWIRVGVAPLAGDRPLDDRAESAAHLNVAQARLFAEKILDEVARLECIEEDLRRAFSS
jgi:hypothetical protein